MTDPGADESRGGDLMVRGATFLLMGILAYVLSIGPVGLYATRLPPEQLAPLRRIYAPLIWLAENTLLGPPLTAYVEWWEKLGRRK